jgi:hypothetical protein
VSRQVGIEADQSPRQENERRGKVTGTNGNEMLPRSPKRRRLIEMDGVTVRVVRTREEMNGGEPQAIAVSQLT